MKRIISYITLIIVFTSLGVIGLLNKKPESVSENILNKKFYKYNTETGEYETLKFKPTTLSYTGNLLNSKKCSSYKYNKNTNIIEACNKKIRLVSSNEEQLILNIDNKNIYFYNTEEKTYNDEFQKTFKMTEENYKKEGENILAPLKIDYNRLINILNSSEKSYIYLLDDTKENTLFNKSFLNTTINTNKYVLELKKLTSDEYNFLKTNYTGFFESKEEYIGPYILITSNNQINETLKIEIKGFNINTYDKYFDEVDNEKNN